MIRIVIGNPIHDDAQWLFHQAKEVISRGRIQSELTYCKDIKKIRENLEDDINHYDVLILDANDEGHKKLVRQLRQKNLRASIIFTTRKSVNLTDLLRSRPSAIITKWKDASQLAEALQYVFDEQLRAKSYFVIKTKEAILRVDFQDICYLESRQRVVVLYTKKKAIQFYAKLNDVSGMLPQIQFVRCHQSYIVNMSNIKTLDKAQRCIELDSGNKIEISKSCYPQVLEKFSAFAGIKDKK